MTRNAWVQSQLFIFTQGTRHISLDLTILILSHHQRKCQKCSLLLNNNAENIICYTTSVESLLILFFQDVARRLTSTSRKTTCSWWVLKRARFTSAPRPTLPTSSTPSIHIIWLFTRSVHSSLTSSSTTAIISDVLIQLTMASALIRMLTLYFMCRKLQEWILSSLLAMLNVTSHRK